MCAVIFISLALTAYLAVYFNRRAKADLRSALDALAERIDGTVDVEEANVTGRYDKKLVIGRMTHADDGPIRVFQVDVIDSAGGTGWLYVSLAPGKDGSARTYQFESADRRLVQHLSLLSTSGLPVLLGANDDWFQVEYSPEGGHVRATRPMGTRKDLPDGDAFVAMVDWLSRLADQNRANQEHSTATQQTTGEGHA